jgi:hypothetical protein
MPYLRVNPSVSATSTYATVSNLTLAAGQSATVGWTLSGLSAATLAVTAYVTAIDAFDTTYPVTTSASVLVVVKSSMATRAVVTPATIVEGGTFRVEFTVTNGGTALMQNLTPSLVLDQPTLAVVGPPSPGLVANLSTGTSATFTWTGVGKSAGTLTLAVAAAGTPFGGQYDSALQTVVLVITAAAGVSSTVPAFAGEAIVYPNPVAGDAVSIAVRLTEAAASIDVDVYNTGYQRVWHGEFPAATKGVWPLEIAGVSKWAPGVYLVRIRATKLGGGTQTFKTLRLGVKR